jgi:hypothetical protein
MLVRWSQNTNVKVRAVTAQLVWSGELPMGGGASRRTAQGAAGLNASGLLRRPARAEEKEWREVTTPWGGEPRLKVQMRRQNGIRWLHRLHLALASGMGWSICHPTGPGLEPRQERRHTPQPGCRNATMSQDTCQRCPETSQWWSQGDSNP